MILLFILFSFIFVLIIIPTLDAIRIFAIWRAKIILAQEVVNNYQRYVDRQRNGITKKYKNKEKIIIQRLPAIYRVFHVNDSNIHCKFTPIVDQMVSAYVDEIGIFETIILYISKKQKRIFSQKMFEEVSDFIENLEGEYFFETETYVT